MINHFRRLWRPNKHGIVIASFNVKKACNMGCEKKGRVRTQDLGSQVEFYDHCATRPVMYIYDVKHWIFYPSLSFRAAGVNIDKKLQKSHSSKPQNRRHALTMAWPRRCHPPPNILFHSRFGRLSNPLIMFRQCTNRSANLRPWGGIGSARTGFLLSLLLSVTSRVCPYFSTLLAALL